MVKHKEIDEDSGFYPWKNKGVETTAMQIQGTDFRLLQKGPN